MKVKLMVVIFISLIGIVSTEPDQTGAVVGIEEPQGTWSSWSLAVGCHSYNISGPSVKKYTRTCSGGVCAEGNDVYLDYNCPSGYLSPGFALNTSDPDRKQCTLCQANKEHQQFYDGLYSLSLPFMRFNRRKFIKIFVKSKHAPNGQPDVEFRSWPSNSLNNDYRLLRNNMPSWNNNFPWNFDRFKRWATQFVFDRFESNVPAFKIGNLTSVGNTFKMNIKGQVTYNPHPDAETYVSTGFYLYDTDEETISIMQNKRKKVPSTGNSPLIHQLEELGPRHLSGHHIRPGLRLRATVRFVFRGNQQTTNIFIKEMVPNLYFRLLNISFFQTYRHPLSNDQNLYRNSTYLSHDATKNHFFAYNKYFDPAYAPYNWIEPTKEYMNLMTDFHDSTYITRPLNTIVADFNYCWNKEGCNETNPNQLTVKRDRGFFSTIPTGSGFPLTSFRIKHIYHGYCWENDPTQNNRIILSSRCRDRFTLGRYRFPSHPFALWHVETELRVRTYGHTDGLMQLHSNEDYKAEFISRAGRIIKPISYTRGDCLIAKDERLTIEDNALFHQNTPCDGGDKENATRVKYLPDYSAHYNVLNMKNVLQTTLPDGSKILLVCDPKRD
uniref:Uncharacterized protein n=1 Tax=Clytia hemisphaerica TaxID=252671 RepID=A0A7M5VFR0_9CNID